MAEDDTRQYSTDELIAMNAKGDFVPTNADAATTDLDEAFWQNARVIMPAGKSSVHLRLDSDVLEWFKAQGKGHLTRMNAVLRSYAEAHKHRPAR